MTDIVRDEALHGGEHLGDIGALAHLSSGAVLSKRAQVANDRRDALRAVTDLGDHLERGGALLAAERRLDEQMERLDREPDVRERGC